MTLETVQQAFKEWRANKIDRKGHIPQQLWEMVKALLAHHKPGVLRTALGISSQQLRRYCTTHDVGPVVPAQHDGFIEARISPPSSDCQLTLQGLNRTLRIALPVEQLANVLPLLEAYL